jgi:LemA family
MDSGTISELVFFVFAAAILIYGFVLSRKLARLREANDRSRAKLEALIRGSADQKQVATAIESFNQSVREYNARIGQFPEAIIAAIMGMQRRSFFK